MSNRDDAQSLQLAFSLHRSGKFAEAAKLYRKVIKKKELEGRPTGMRFAVSSDGKKLYFFGNASIEIFDSTTLESRKLVDLKRDTTTNLVTLPQTASR